MDDSTIYINFIPCFTCFIPMGKGWAEMSGAISLGMKRSPGAPNGMEHRLWSGKPAHHNLAKPGDIVSGTLFWRQCSCRFPGGAFSIRVLASILASVQQSRLTEPGKPSPKPDMPVWKP
jgi:hypothetical protein